MTRLTAVTLDAADQVAVGDLVEASDAVLAAAASMLEGEFVLELHLGAVAPGSVSVIISAHRDGVAPQRHTPKIAPAAADELVQAAGVFVVRALDRLGEGPGHLVHEMMRAGASLLVEIHRDAVRLYLCRWNQKLELLAALISRAEHTPVVATKTD